MDNHNGVDVSKQQTAAMMFVAEHFGNGDFAIATPFILMPNGSHKRLCLAGVYRTEEAMQIVDALNARLKVEEEV
jgi:hypothetical protein